MMKADSFAPWLTVVVLGVLVVALDAVRGGSDEDVAFGFSRPLASVTFRNDGALRRARTAIRERTKRQFSTASGERLWILDEYVGEEVWETARSYIQFSAWWGFQLTARDGTDKDAGGDGVPWGARLNVEEFMSLQLGRELGKLAAVFAADGTKEGKSAPARDLPQFVVSEVTYKVVRRGDLTAVHYGSGNESGDVWMAVFLNDRWNVDHYGEMLIYDSQEEVVGAANPRLGRILAWTPTLGYLCQPPSIDFSQGENILLVKWSTNGSKAQELEAQRRQDHVGIKAGIAGGFPLRSAEDLAAAASMDVGGHEVVRRRAQTGKQVVAFDGLFSEDELLALRSYTVSHGKVFYDDDIDGFSDNVQWISGFGVSYFVQTKFWSIIRKIAMYVSEGVGDWYPYDVSCNIIRSYDHTRIHGDVRNEKDDEWTFLLYLSPMGDDDYGETAYFTQNSHDTEIVYQVKPRYGRAVIFEGLIPHAARPPSPVFKGPRYSFAVKMAKTPSRAFQHMLYEAYSQGGNYLLPTTRGGEPQDAEVTVQRLTDKYKGSASSLNRTYFQLESAKEKAQEKMKRGMLKQSAAGV